MSEMLSALTDGQATPEEVARACAAWRDDPQARAAWHRYHLIGDALRSPELLQAGTGSAFLQGFRARLAQEPVVLAPQAAHAVRVDHVHAAGASAGDFAASSSESAASSLREAQRPKPRPWAGPAAVAASFVMLVGLMASNLSGVNAPASSGSLAAAQDTSSGGGWGSVVSSLDATPRSNRLQSVQAMGASFDSTDQTEGVLLRDPRVEPLLSLQRPMVIDPPAATFAEPGLPQTVAYTAP